MPTLPEDEDIEYNIVIKMPPRKQYTLVLLRKDKLLDWLKQECKTRADVGKIDSGETDEGLRLTAFCNRCQSYALQDVINYIEEL